MRRLALALCILAAAVAGPARAATAPTWSQPRIVFESDRSGNRDVWTIGPTGADPVQLTNNAAADQAPYWSPDGSRIAFHSTRTGGGDIYVMNADGTDVRRLTTSSAFDGFPVWSSTDRIAFISNRGGTLYGTNEIWSMNSDGSDQRRLTFNTWPDGYPSWTPDGSRIVYTAQPVIEGSQDQLLQDTEIFSMAADGTDRVQLTDNVCDDHAPAPSPDGARIVYTSDCGRVWAGVTVMNADGTGIEHLTANVDYEDWPTWSPDGTHLVYATSGRGSSAAGTNLAILDLSTRRTYGVTYSRTAFDGLGWFAPTAANESSTLGVGHIDLGQPAADTRTMTVLAEATACGALVVDAGGSDGFMLPAPPAGSTLDTHTIDHGGRGYALNLNFHGGAVCGPRPWLGGCSPGWFIGGGVPRLEVTGCRVPVGATTVEVSADTGIDLDVTVTIRS